MFLYKYLVFYFDILYRQVFVICDKELFDVLMPISDCWLMIQQIKTVLTTINWFNHEDPFFPLQWHTRTLC